MRVVFLGTSAGVPTLRRNLAALAIEREGELLLFDCGEAAQIQIRRAGLRWGRLTALFISHLHADHVTGLPGLLLSLAMAERRAPLTLVGPAGLQDYVRCSLRLLGAGLPYTLAFREADEGVAWEGQGYCVAAALLDHRVRCLGYALREAPRPGEFNVEAAERLGIPAGPLFGQLQRGEPVVLGDGRIVQPAQVLGPPRAGRAVAYCTDTRPCEAAVDLARGADLLIHEATLDASLAAEAHAKGHSTAADAARIALSAGVRRLMLTHVSSRYERADLLRDQARAVFPHTEVAEDLLSIEVPRPE